MKREKVLPMALCGCVLALCVSAGVAVYFWQESREAEAQLAAAREQIETLETTLSQNQEQLARMEEELKYAQLKYEWATETDNPIDRYRYASGRDSGSTTYEMSANAAFFREAWKQEFEHLVNKVKEDRQSNPRMEEQWVAEYCQELDRYRSAVEAQVDSMVNLILLEWDVGYKGTSASIAIPGYASSIYRNGTLELLDNFSEPFEWQKVYSYAFDEDTVTQIREKVGDPLAERMPGEQLFPPLSQVLPDQP